MNNKTTLLLINKKLHIFLEDDILTIKLLEGSFTDEIIDKMFEVIKIFYEICKNKNKKFYTIYDTTECCLTNLPNYLYYINSISTFLKSHHEFYKKYLHKTLIITKTELGKKLCNSVLMNYTPTRPIKFINSDDPINFDF
jgi:hypothetical protein